jgi:hypothetical protein
VRGDSEVEALLIVLKCDALDLGRFVPNELIECAEQRDDCRQRRHIRRQTPPSSGKQPGKGYRACKNRRQYSIVPQRMFHGLSYLLSGAACSEANALM